MFGQSRPKLHDLGFGPNWATPGLHILRICVATRFGTLKNSNTAPPNPPNQLSCFVCGGDLDPKVASERGEVVERRASRGEQPGPSTPSVALHAPSNPLALATQESSPSRRATQIARILAGICAKTGLFEPENAMLGTDSDGYAGSARSFRGDESRPRSSSCDQAPQGGGWANNVLARPRLAAHPATFHLGGRSSQARHTSTPRCDSPWRRAP